MSVCPAVHNVHCPGRKNEAVVFIFGRNVGNSDTKLGLEDGPSRVKAMLTAPRTLKASQPSKGGTIAFLFLLIIHKL